jgi:cyclophilin family peptidyl-prolyl cis-trans isomerase
MNKNHALKLFCILAGLWLLKAPLSGQAIPVIVQDDLFVEGSFDLVEGDPPAFKEPVYRPVEPLDLTSFIEVFNVPGPTATMSTNLGDIRLQLFSVIPPENEPELEEGRAYRYADPAALILFLRNSREGRYDNSIFHRSVVPDPEASTPFGILQGGAWNTTAPDSPFLLEPVNPAASALNPVFTVPNIPGTIAWAEDGAGTARSDFYFNTSDNSGDNFTTLDSRGFGVFGKVIEGYEKVESFNNKEGTFPVFNMGVSFAEMPLRNYSQEDYDAFKFPGADNWALLQRVTIDPSLELLPTFSIIFPTEEEDSSLVSSSYSEEDWETPRIEGTQLIMSPRPDGAGSAANIVVRAELASDNYIDFGVTYMLRPAFRFFFRSAVTSESGWFTDNVFGWMAPSENFLEPSERWFYHLNHGWLFLSGEGETSSTNADIWWFDANLGWVYTRRDLYPYLYVLDHSQYNPPETIDPQFSGKWVYYQTTVFTEPEGEETPEGIAEQERGFPLIPTRTIWILGGPDPIRTRG